MALALPAELPSRPSVRIRWRETVATESPAEGVFTVRSESVRITLSQLSAPILAGLEQLGPPGVDEAAIADRLAEEESAATLTRWYYTLDRLASRGLIVRSLYDRGVPIATLIPIAPGFRLVPLAVRRTAGAVRLCRFAYLRRVGDVPVLESPRSHARVVFDDPEAAAIVAALARPIDPTTSCVSLGPVRSEAVTPLLGLLADGGFLDPAGPEAGAGEPLPAWEFHDLLFHARSRKGRSDAPFGATYRPEANLEPPPALKNIEAAEWVDLAQPDLAKLERDDPPLARVLESRRSLRTYAERPISAAELGEFLFRVGRVRGSRTVELETPGGVRTVEFCSRPYPSGGALYELDFYVAVGRCDGLERGLYRYEARRHRLARVPGAAADPTPLLHDAAASAGIDRETPQVLIVLTARFQRLSWKYASIAYALILKHVGVLYQTMYLAATAMGLAPCALGGGDSDLFARSAGLDYDEETSVGEFLLGSRLPDADAWASP